MSSSSRKPAPSTTTDDPAPETRGSPLTPALLELTKCMREHGGVIHRHSSGFWARAGWRPPERSFRTTSIRALVARGIAEYCKFEFGPHRRYPTQARFVPSPKTKERPHPECAAPTHLAA